MRNFMHEDFRNLVIMTKRSELLPYIDADQLPAYLGGKCQKSFREVPDGCVELVKCTHLNLNQKQSEKILSTFKDALKEAENEK